MSECRGVRETLHMWTHRQKWAGGDPDQRTVLKGNLVAGYIARLSFGPNRGQWQWYGAWAAQGNSGIVESQDQALTAIRTRFDELEKTDRDRLECYRERPYG